MSSLRKKQKGVVAIEVALGFFAFWMMIAMWVEMSYMAYVSAVGDYAITEASRVAKKDTEDYLTVFKTTLSNNNSIWSKFVDPNNFSLSVNYVADLSALGTVTQCVAEDNALTTCGTENMSAIAIYYLSYDYTSVFTSVFDNSSVFDREVIVIQEYERSEF